MRSITCVAAVALALVTACAPKSAPPATASSASAAATDTLGKFIWHDLITDDIAAARRFYSDLLGWQFSDSTRNGRVYVLARSQGRLVGGLVPVPAVANQEVSEWISFQSVANVDDSVASVARAGGKTLTAPLNVSVGRAAIVSDPQGAPLGLLRLSGPDPADEPAPILNTFFWMEYVARDPVAGATFYSDTFGYQQSVTDRLGPIEYRVLSRGRPRAGIQTVPRADMRPTWLPYVLVADAAPLVARVRSLGGTVLLEPRADIRNGSLAVVTDPSGAIVALQKYPF